MYLSSGEILQDLQRYEVLYEGRKEMLCNMCSRTFTEASLFQAHVKAHQVSSLFQAHVKTHYGT
jgi:hypothetical protein